jgi:hypothetical protein
MDVRIECQQEASHQMAVTGQNVLVLNGLANFRGRLLSRNLTDNSCERNELHIESSGLFCDSLQSLVLVFGFVELSPSVYVVMTNFSIR